MDNLQDILSRYQKPEQPELAAVKRYIDDQFHIPVSAAINGETIIVTVPSAAFANTLRLQTQAIQEICQTTKRLQFRIG